MNQYSALIKIAGVDLGEHSYSVMSPDVGEDFIHINNHKADKNSIITRLSELRKAMEILESQLASRDANH